MSGQSEFRRASMDVKPQHSMCLSLKLKAAPQKKTVHSLRRTSKNDPNHKFMHQNDQIRSFCKDPPSNQAFVFFFPVLVAGSSGTSAPSSKICDGATSDHGAGTMTWLAARRTVLDPSLQILAVFGLQGRQDRSRIVEGG